MADAIGLRMRWRNCGEATDVDEVRPSGDERMGVDRVGFYWNQSHR